MFKVPPGKDLCPIYTKLRMVYNLGMLQDHPVDILAHAVHGSYHLRPEGMFSPLCGMKKALKPTGLKIDAWRQDQDVQHCKACEHAAKHFGYLSK